jgi:hypothetical protein
MKTKLFIAAMLAAAGLAGAQMFAQLFAATSTARLPAEYQEVQYLESSGTQYIDTGVANTSSTDWAVDFLLPTYSAHSYIFGMIDEVVLHGIYNGLISGTTTEINNYRAGYNATLTGNVAGILTNRCTISRIGNLLKYNGATTQTFTAGTWSSDYTLTMFAVPNPRIRHVYKDSGA